ncbi:MAG: hypothetical protein R2697_07705 [Ilumatobacteraceae bacterium]
MSTRRHRPDRTSIRADGLIWADTTPDHPTLTPAMRHHAGRGVARTTYTTAHHPTWGSKVSGYLLTKAVAAGLMLVAALARGAGAAGPNRPPSGVVPPIVAACSSHSRGAPRRRPEAVSFLYILTKSNPRSWLVRGAWILGAFAAIVAVWGLIGIADAGGARSRSSCHRRPCSPRGRRYTAFLFGQCEGRDLWQTPLLLPILLAQAVAAAA